jgi:hypothetical protein
VIIGFLVMDEVSADEIHTTIEAQSGADIYPLLAVQDFLTAI